MDAPTDTRRRAAPDCSEYVGCSLGPLVYGLGLQSNYGCHGHSCTSYTKKRDRPLSALTEEKRREVALLGIRTRLHFESVPRFRSN